MRSEAEAGGAAGAGGGASGLGLPRLDLSPQEKDLVARMGCSDGKNAWQVGGYMSVWVWVWVWVSMNGCTSACPLSSPLFLSRVSRI